MFAPDRFAPERPTLRNTVNVRSALERFAPSKKESSSIILIKKEGSKVIPQIIPISEIPLVSSMSGKMNILRAYTQQKNRNKVEIAAKSILGEL